MQALATVSVPLSALTVDESLYPRRFIDKSRVNRYAEAMKAGAKFPPIIIATVKGKTVIIDGVHRYEAKKRIGGQKAAECEDLGRMSEIDAFAEAVKRNAQHGKMLTKIEQFAAYKRLIQEGYGIEKAESILSIRDQDIQRWKTRGGLTNVVTGQKVTPQFDRKMLLWRIREIKSIIKAGLNGDEQVEKKLRDLSETIDEFLEVSPTTLQTLRDLRDLLTRMEQRHSPGTIEDLAELRQLIERSIPKP